MTAASPRTTTTFRTAALAGLAVLAACAGCTTSSSEPPTPSGAAATPEPALTAAQVERNAAVPTAASGVDGGCTTVDTAPPADASIEPTADLDHDGRADELWLGHANGQQLLGVRTAAGGSFATPFTTPAGPEVTALGQVLDADTSIVLLNAELSARLFAVADCRVVPSTSSTDANGQQVTFDLGPASYGSTFSGTGVACEPADPDSDVSQGLALYGLDARGAADGSWTVSSTRIDLSNGGREAARGAATDLATGVAAGDDVVQTAQEVTCGDQRTGPTEPVR